MKSGEIRPLTGIRGLAACLVMVLHLGSGQIGGPLGRNGYLAVDLFFVLSGFVMALTYANALEEAPTLAAYWNFLGKRLARIYPLYLLMTVIMGLFVVAGMDAPAALFPGPVVAANVVLAQAWAIGPSLDYTAWSISTEWVAYLLFPVLIVLPLRARPSVQVAAAVTCLAVIIGLSMLPTTSVHALADATGHRHGPLDIADGATAWPVVRCLAEFTVGLLVWRLCRTATMARLVTGPRTTALACAALVLLCLPGVDVAVVVAFAALVAALAFDRGIAAQLLGSKGPRALGEWSYAIYLLHPACGTLIAPLTAFLVARHVPHAWSLAAAAAITLTLPGSWALHHAVERPARDWVRQAFTPRLLA